MMRLISLAAAFVLVLSIQACGYRFAGGGKLPGGVEKIFVSVFENRSLETDLENRLSNDIINEIILNKKGTIVGRSQAEAILSGEIVSVATDTLTQTGAGASVEREVTVVLNLTLRSQSGRTLWKASGLSSSEPYDVGGDSSETDDNRALALEELSRRTAERIYNRMTEDF